VIEKRAAAGAREDRPLSFGASARSKRAKAAGSGPPVKFWRFAFDALIESAFGAGA
jgi:hypothetical protein